MSKVRVPIHGKPHGFTTVDDGATRGAVVGTNLYWPDGTLVTVEDIEGLTNATTTTTVVGGVNTTPSVTVWSIIQDIPANIAALAGLATSGLVVRQAAGTWTTRTLATGSATRITVANGDGDAGAPTVDLATVANGGGGTFYKVTVDSYGRVSGYSAVAAGDITALVDATYVNVSGDTMTGYLTLHADPSSAMHAATKQYVDSLAGGGDGLCAVVDQLGDVMCDQNYQPIATG